MTDAETLRRRRLVAAGVGILALLILLLGIRSCLDSRAENALKDYNREVAAIVDSSDTEVSRQLFDVLGSGGSATDVEPAINQLRLVAQDLVKRAQDLDVPDDMGPAQRNLELVLNLRAEGVEQIAEAVPAALGDRAGPQQEAVEKIAGQMQAFLASDVVFSQRVAPLIKETLDENEVGGQRVPESTFLPTIAWLDPSAVGDRLGAEGAGATSTNEEPAPGLHGHGLLGVEAGGIALQPGGAVNRIPAAADLTFDVTFANQGDNDETNVRVTVEITGAGSPIRVNKRVNQTRAGANATVSIPLGRTPPVGQSVTIEVSVAKVPGEEKVDNNSSEYTAIFTR